MPLTRSGTLGKVEFFPNTPAISTRASAKPGTGAQRIGDSLCESIAAVGLEKGESQNGAVGRDQRQIDTHRAKCGGTEFAYQHLDELDGRGDNEDI